MKCDSCLNDAAYVLNQRGSKIQNFCNKHLPIFLREKAKLGLLTPPAVATDEPTGVSEAPVVSDTPAPKKNKKSKKEAASSEVVNESVETEIPVNEVPDESDTENTD